MDAVSLPQVVFTFLLNASFACMVGTASARYWLRTAAAPWQRPVNGLLDRGEGAAALLCMLATCGAVWAAAAVMAGVPLAEAVPAIPLMVSGTSVGQAACMGAMALALVIAFRLASRGTARFGAAIAILLLVFAASRASVSHAGEHGLLSIDMAIELAHLVLIALWTGGVAVAAWVVLPRAGRRDAALHAYLDSLSTWAGVALAGIVASGIYNSWQRLNAVAELADPGYGMTLTVKVALVAGAVLIGAYNKFAGFPGARSSSPMMDRVILLLRIESVLLFGALLAAAMLTSQQPPAAQ
ncbi:copper resistance D family protein [Massilia cavernae]|uniref:Copper resistance protein CopD n=1 Tax=Massilia cavernae TaxID=2320864 RepID=A0A418XY13_9BURK|nr:CopD family protein [Massilia cavernae]RJG17866.1 copper resistance protein CopD [Massilia cavernae]